MTLDELRRDQRLLSNAARALDLVADDPGDAKKVRQAQSDCAPLGEALARLEQLHAELELEQKQNIDKDRAALRQAINEFWRASGFDDRRAAMIQVGDLFAGTRQFLETLTLLCAALLTAAKDRGSYAFKDFAKLVDDVARDSNIPLAEVKSPVFQSSAIQRRLLELTKP